MEEEDGDWILDLGLPKRAEPGPLIVASTCSLDEMWLGLPEPSPPPPIIECRVPTVPLNAVDIEECAGLFSPEEVQQAMIRLIRKLLQSGPYSLIDMPAFLGNGIYAIYYHGDHAIYGPLCSPGSTCPIYLGKGDKLEGDGLVQRLRKDHTQTIQATALGLENFTVRFVCLPRSLIEFAERNLIDMYKPLWNIGLPGFGKRRGAGESGVTPDQQVSPWDTEHPGRDTKAVRPRDPLMAKDAILKAIPSILHRYQAVMKLITENESTNAQDQEVGPPGASSTALDAGWETLDQREESLPAHVRQRGYGPDHPTQQEAEDLDGFDL